MTRQFKQVIRCPSCGYTFPAESPFNAWLRNCPDLDSRLHGISIVDLDLVVHRYKTATDRVGTRDLQALMVVEVKTHGGHCTDAQRDTLHTLNQVLNNRRPGRGHRAWDHSPPCKVKSLILGRKVSVRLLGAHLLVLERETPEDSRWMYWDKKRIDLAMLIELLRCERDPHTLQRMDWRRHHVGTRTHERLLFDYGGNGNGD